MYTKKSKGGKVFVLTIAREIIGGGVKDENQQLARARVATCLLERGTPLPEATVATEKLVQQAGASACIQALSKDSHGDRWDALAQLATKVDCHLPLRDSRTEKAVRRPQAAVRRRKLQKTSTGPCQGLHAPGRLLELHGRPPKSST